MRIIDKNRDYYDYLQNPEDPLVFDRRGSFFLEKQHICEALNVFSRRRFNDKYNHILLQCGSTFWVFLLTITKFNKLSNFMEIPADYELELLTTWKNYIKPNKLLDIRLVDFPENYISWNFRDKTIILHRERINADEIRISIDQIREFNVHNSSSLGTLKENIHTKRGFESKEYTFPLLSRCGIASHIAPLDIFCAIEEYFSIEKTASERTEAVGATNDDKIIMHGFDTKTSFRGK